MPMEDSWNYWWSYSGPTYWGLLNPDWLLCHKGRQQSPVNIETRLLVYDPQLGPLRADNDRISGVLLNDGHSIVFNCSRAAVQLAIATAAASPVARNDSGGPREPPDERLANELSPLDKDQRADGREGPTPGKAGRVEPLDDSPTDSRHSDGDRQPVDTNQQQQLEAPRVRFSGAGLAYQFQLETIHLKFGTPAAGGSEHQIDSKSFAAELQLFAFNADLFESFAEASTRPNGLLAVSVMIKPADGAERANEHLERLLDANLARLGHRGQSVLVAELNVSALLAEPDEFVTYQGSLSQPSCQESVNWLILNKPSLMSQSSLDKLRSLSADEQSAAPSGTLLAGNARPIQPINGRPIRTNIKPPQSSANELRDSRETCQRLWTRYAYKPFS